MECTQVAEVPDDPARWLYEVKLDGYRCCAVVDRRGRAQLYSRYGNPWPERFPEIHEALSELNEPLVLDAEIVAVDAKGRPSFQELQNWQSTRWRIVFYAFDITHRDGRDLMALPIEERKAMLADVAQRFREPLRLAEALDAGLRTLVPKMKTLGLEGIVAKRRGSTYRSGERTPAWIKHRFNEIGEYVIGGYIAEADTFSRLLIGEWRGRELHFLHKLRNGFSRITRKQVMQALRGLEIDECPFVNPEDDATWVRPVRMVEVEFVERTAGGRLRHAFFRRLMTPDDRSSAKLPAGRARRRADTR
jgi:bifunctional non-homologous end joining protein LigD